MTDAVATQLPEARNVFQYLLGEVAAPNATALIADGTELSYAQVKSYAEAIAGYLDQQGLGPGDTVGVMLPRNLFLVPTLLGLLRQGVCYVPLDPDYPHELLHYVIENAQLSLIFTTAAIAEKVKISADTESADPEQVISSTEKSLASELAAPVDKTRLAAYVIYTSGSTGKPKGVEVGHRSVINFLQSMCKSPGLDSQDTLLAVTTLSFDISVLELFGPLTAGGRTVLASRLDALDAVALLKLIEQHQVTVVQATPVTWRMLANAGFGQQRPRAWCGGEALPKDVAEQLLSMLPELWNLYGPTETTVWSTAGQLTDADDIHIGQAIDNTELLVLDENGCSAAAGVPGELLIAGTGLAHGYVRLEEQTARAFVPHPELEGQLAYRTGDMVRLREDGNLQHLGRLDDQIKIRGFRVEPGQIESCLMSEARVLEAVVKTKEVGPGDQRLIAYIVPDTANPISNSELQRHARVHLPDYMVPQFFVTISEVPRTPNGKIDRSALPDAPALVPQAASDAPIGVSEIWLAELWERLVGVNQVMRSDNFFYIGGHSLLAMEVLKAVTDRFDRELSMQTLATATLAEIATELQQPVSDPSQSQTAGFWTRLVGKLVARKG